MDQQLVDGRSALVVDVECYVGGPNVMLDPSSIGGAAIRETNGRADG
jgi:hypothetical protein